MNDFQAATGFKVISGGQTGVDLAGIRAAQCLGFKTGGFAPKHFKTQRGFQIGLGPNFGLVEHTGGYSARTRANVLLADATLIIAADTQSAGTKLTIETAAYCDKPTIILQVNKAPGQEQYMPIAGEKVSEAAGWIVDMLDEVIAKHGHFVLNIAGNASESAPGIFVPAFIGMLQILHSVQQMYEARKALNPDPNVAMAANQLAQSDIATALQDNFNAYPDLNPRYRRILILDQG